MEANDHLLVDIADHVATLTLNRPEQRNALTVRMRRELPAIIDELAGDDAVRVIVITGAGERAFCAGADLKEVDEVREQGERLETPMTGQYRNAFEAVLESTKPTIASIDGFAVAGGFELALACDLRVATTRARFGLPEARIGMGANFASVLLPRLIPRALALELMYTGAQIDAGRALEIGLLNRVVEPECLGEETASLAATLAGNAPLTLQRYKAMSLRGWDLPVAAALRLNTGPNPYTSRDRAEGVQAFLEKRAPKWQGA